MIQSAIEQYFLGERHEMQAILSGVFVLFVAGFLLRRSGESFARGLSLPLLLTAVIFACVAIPLLIRDNQHKAKLVSQISTQFEQVRNEEMQRITNVIKWYPYYRYVYLISIVSALFLFLFKHRAFWQGTAVGLLVFASIGFVIDHYSENRARNYQSLLMSSHKI